MAKRVISFISCILVLVMCAAGCAQTSEADSALGAYVEACETCNSQAIVDLVPAALFDFQCERLVLAGYSEEDAKAEVTNRYGAPLAKADFIRMHTEIDLTKEFDFTYTITSRYSASADEVAQLNSFVSDTHGFELNAEDVVLYKYTYSIASQNDIYSVQDVRDMGVALSIEGKWYYLAAGQTNQILWADGFGMNVENTVEWIYNWLRDN